jgi:hypothetical protein
MRHSLNLTAQDRRNIVERWSPIIDAEGESKITDTNIRETMAFMFENTHGSLSEAYADAGNAMSAMGTGAAPSTMGDFSVPGATADSRMPHIVMPLLRRTFPELLAHDLVGVQAMAGPIGFAFALRYKYGVNGKGTTVASGNELGFDTIDSAHTGASGAVDSNPDWYAAFAGAGNTAYGEAASLEDSEFWGINSDMPMASIGLEKGIIVAKSRKFATSYSLEQAEDMMHTQGIDVDEEMVSILGAEVKMEIDRELVERMVRLAIADTGARSTWDPTYADGNTQLDRIGTLYTHVLQKANQIALRSRVGSGNWVISSPNVAALLERVGDYALDTVGGLKQETSDRVVYTGTLRNGRIKTYRDNFAQGDYVLIGHKGAAATQTGVVYCPYIPIQLMRATGENTFNPRIAVRTRYGIQDNMFGASNFYQFIKVDNISGIALQAEDSRYFAF